MAFEWNVQYVFVLKSHSFSLVLCVRVCFKKRKKGNFPLVLPKSWKGAQLHNQSKFKPLDPNPAHQLGQPCKLVPVNISTLPFPAERSSRIQSIESIPMSLMVPRIVRNKDSVYLCFLRYYYFDYTKKLGYTNVDNCVLEKCTIPRISEDWFLFQLAKMGSYKTACFGFPFFVLQTLEQSPHFNQLGSLNESLFNLILMMLIKTQTKTKLSLPYLQLIGLRFK